MSLVLYGTGISKGIAIGSAHILGIHTIHVEEISVSPELVDQEISRYRKALGRARSQLRDIMQQIPEGTALEVGELVNAHLMMMEDPAMVDAPTRIIAERCCNAEWALKLQSDEIVAPFDEASDPYLRSRKEDIIQVVQRVQRALQSQAFGSGPETSPISGRIVVTESLAPADLAQLYQQGVRGLVVEHGGALSHAAILAKSLRIPTIMGLHNACQLLLDEDSLIVDGEQGVVLCAASPKVTRHYQARQKVHRRNRRNLEKVRGKPMATADGKPLSLQANVELPIDLDKAREAGASGIGLYRTEFLFMNRDVPPSEDEQYEMYVDAVNSMDGAPVTVRTLDLGADKQTDGKLYNNLPANGNPALGRRAVRLCLSEPELFTPQIRAILRASAHGPIRILIPLLTNAQELFQVKNMVAASKKELLRSSVSVADQVPLGAMIEVPAAAISARVFAKHLDFLSIGTNDLIQYTLAIDRTDEDVAYLYDPMHPSVLHLLHTIISAGLRTDTPVSMCGEMAGDTRYSRLLLGMGLREFSMHPGCLLEVKNVLRSTQVDDAIGYSKRILRSVNPVKINQLLRELNEKSD